MKASQFTDAQKAFIIKQGEDGTPVAEICRKAGISQATYFNWKKKYAGVLPSEMRRLRELEQESPAEEDRGGPVAGQGDAAGRHQAKALRPGRKRTLVDAMRSEWAISIRRACAVILFDPKTYRYKSRRPGQGALEQRIKEICQTSVRFGYRRVHVLLKREGWEINAKRTRPTMPSTAGSGRM